MDCGDLHYCEAFPSGIDDSLLANNPSPSLNDGQFFDINVKLTETKMVFDPKKDDFDCLNDKTSEYRFPNISLAAMEEERTTQRMLSDIGVPEDAQDFMTFKIMTCARNMAQCTHKTLKVLPMRVLIYITTSFEEETNVEDDEEEDKEEQEGFAEELMEDQSGTSLVPETNLEGESEGLRVQV